MLRLMLISTCLSILMIVKPSTDQRMCVVGTTLIQDTDAGCLASMLEPRVSSKKLMNLFWLS